MHTCHHPTRSGKRMKATSFLDYRMIILIGRERTIDVRRLGEAVENMHDSGIPWT
jgi:hypothetical protein